MKKILLLQILFLFLTEAFALSQSADNPVAYLESISKIGDSITNDMWSYVKAAAHNKFVFQVENKRRQLLKTIKNGLIQMNKISDYNGDSSYKGAVIKYLESLYAILNEDYAKLVDMEQISEQSYDKMEAYLLAKQKSQDKIEEIVEILNKSLEVFAKKNNITLIVKKSDIIKNLEKSSEVIQYFNKIYLIFFKSNKQELYLITAQNKSNLNEIEQNRVNLIKYCDEGLLNLKKIKPYENDSSLLIEAEKALTFYKKEASEKFLLITDYFIKQDNFNKISKAFQKKRSSETTEEEVEQYNKKVDDYNKEVNAYNKVNNELNMDRAKIVQSWNKTSSVFIDNHVPK
ncbi:MAG: hypothetical protein JXB50_16270 [Spirochaetes bacterium]|nr:hypothetical protein [Spirochaetota bacterium]